jgi:hypothetical protein
MAREYVFIDEWDVDAPQQAIFEALADAHNVAIERAMAGLEPYARSQSARGNA